MESNTDKLLHDQGLRITAARRAVVSGLSDSSRALSASELHAAVERSGQEIDLVTVYRSLEALERCSIVSRVDRNREGWRYAVRSREHRHEVVCSRCGATAALDLCELDRVERMLERQTGFSNIHHALSFFGTCPQCR
jgi:Fe2+ or Zn2+ uptake regulation protein